MANKTIKYEALNKFDRIEFRANLLSLAYKMVEGQKRYSMEYNEETGEYDKEPTDTKEKERLRMIDEVLEEIENML